jgi:RNA polymerase sigma-70 factor (ECF subfamily)
VAASIDRFLHASAPWQGARLGPTPRESGAPHWYSRPLSWNGIASSRIDVPGARPFVTTADRAAAFEAAVLPHARAAYSLARWLARDVHDAEDVVQEAWLRAFKYFDGFDGSDARAWFLSIVRNAFHRWNERRARADTVRAGKAADDESDRDVAIAAASREDDPAHAALRASEREVVNRAIGELPVEYREVVVLRELEGLSYKEIAAVVSIPIGTVMSRLARARERLRDRLAATDRDAWGGDGAEARS